MEILFRGFHKQANGPDVAIIDGVAERGRWFEGSLVKMGPVGYTHYYILPDYASAFYEIEVIPSTVGQYTGLTDKNGKKIFQGDIVHCVGGEFFQGYHELEEDIVVEDITDGTCVYFGEVESLDVVGNIYAPSEGGANV